MWWEQKSYGVIRKAKESWYNTGSEQTIFLRELGAMTG